jgi:hypothetical protein
MIQSGTSSCEILATVTTNFAVFFLGGGGCNVEQWRNEVPESCSLCNDGRGVTTLKTGSATSSGMSYAFKATNFHCVTSQKAVNFVTLLAVTGLKISNWELKLIKCEF